MANSLVPDELARLLLRREMPSHGPAELVRATDAVFARLDSSLSLTIGNIGFQALVSRALIKAQEKNTALAEITAGAASNNHWLQGLDKSIERYGASTATNSVVGIITELIEVLGRFVGAELAGRLIQAAWPESIGEEVKPSDSAERT